MIKIDKMNNFKHKFIFNIYWFGCDNKLSEVIKATLVESANAKEYVMGWFPKDDIGKRLTIYTDSDELLLMLKLKYGGLELRRPAQ